MGETTGVKVLLVEDNAMVRDSLVELIEVLGHRVTAVAQAEAALEALAAEGYDVLLSDLSLPGMSGLDLAKQVHAQHPSMRLVLATGYGHLIDPAQAGLPGMATLPKPVDIDRLEALLADIAAGRA